MAEIFEIGMVLCFGASWPFNVIRAYKARTAKGTSLLFTLLIEIGYISAIIGKFILISQQGTAYWTPSRAIAFCTACPAYGMPRQHPLSFSKSRC